MGTFLNLLFIPGGIAMIVYAEPIVRFFGKIDFAENYLPGGTYNAIKLIGLVISLLSFMYLVGGFEALGNSQFTRFF